jgi:hypothetical protein
MFSDDWLLEKLVLKGGNALDIVYKVADRGSVDVDFSMEKEFKKEELPAIENKIKGLLDRTFGSENYVIFDLELTERPKIVNSATETFWGGYQVEFKLIEASKFKELDGELDKIRRNATVIDHQQRRKFIIDISKFEFCSNKQQSELEGFTIYVYTPEMIVLEKIRAICQQMPEYLEHVKNNTQSPRARDFFDIYKLVKHFNIDVTTPENIQLLQNIFVAKKVPLLLIGKIPSYREYHREDFPTVKSIVKPGIVLKDFDFYFDFVVKQTQKLKTLWKV